MKSGHILRSDTVGRNKRDREEKRRRIIMMINILENTSSFSNHISTGLIAFVAGYNHMTCVVTIGYSDENMFNISK